MKNILKTFYILILFIFSLVIQLFVFNNINLFGVKPNILFISCIVMGLYTNIYLSTIYSFTLGVVVDLLFGSLGMFTNAYWICWTKLYKGKLCINTNFNSNKCNII